MTAGFPATPRTGSVCTGYAGLDIAVQAVFGGSLAWVADNDPGAARILAHRFPGVPNLGDITAVDWASVPRVDIVTGGYPCQPFSTAGKRKGVADARHLWPHIAGALGVLRPRLGIFENVAGHLSLGFDTVLADLARLGFDALWCCVRASDLGAAHQRRRLFFLTWPADAAGAGCEGLRLPGRASGRGDAAADAVSLGGDRHRACGAGRDEPAAHRVATAHPAGLGEREPADQAHPLASRGPARPVTRGRGGRVAADAAGGGQQRHPDLDPGEAGAQGGPDADGRGRAAPEWGDYRAAIARWEAVLGRPAPGPVDAVGRLSAVFVEWLMGLPAGHVTAVPGLSRTAQLKALGNGVMPLQAAAAFDALLSSPAFAEATAIGAATEGRRAA